MQDELTRNAPAIAAIIFFNVTDTTEIYTRDQVLAVVNRAADLAAEVGNPSGEEYSGSIRDTSLLDLAVNLVSYLVDHPKATLDEAIAATYTDVQPEFYDLDEDELKPEPGSPEHNAAIVETVKGWLA